MTPRKMAIIALSAMSAVAFASDVAPIKVPYIEVGDCWTFQTENLVNRGPVDAYEECITFVDRNKNVLLAVAKLKDGREIDTSYTFDMASISSMDGMISPGGAQFIKFPAKAGDSYSVAFEFRRAILGAMAGKSMFDMEIVGWEDVSVPAGTFRALKFEGRGMVHRYDINAKGKQEMTFWYAPEIGRAIKLIYRSPAISYRRELTAYRLNK